MNTDYSYTYIVECSDGSLYTGWTKDIQKRMASHNAGKASKYTRSRLPVQLMTFWTFASSNEAMKFEAYLKGLPRTEKLALALKQKESGNETI